MVDSGFSDNSLFGFAGSGYDPFYSPVADYGSYLWDSSWDGFGGTELWDNPAGFASYGDSFVDPVLFGSGFDSLAPVWGDLWSGDDLLWGAGGLDSSIWSDPLSSYDSFGGYGYYDAYGSSIYESSAWNDALWDAGSSLWGDVGSWYSDPYSAALDFSSFDFGGWGYGMDWFSFGASDFGLSFGFSGSNSGFSFSFSFSFPLVLDLSGDGHANIDILDQGFTTFFDLDDDDYKESTAWAAAEDGLLVIDLAEDGSSGPDGVISQTREVVFTEWHEDAESDLEGLALAFDTNEDGVFDADDDRFDEFRVWQDSDQDGEVDEGELRTLAEVGITGIELTSNEERLEYPDGSFSSGGFTVHLEGEQTMLGADMAFARHCVSNAP